MMEVRYVEWIDSSGVGKWMMLSEARNQKPVTCKSTGFVVAESGDHVTLIQSLDDQIGDDQHADNSISIPKIAITKSRTLRKASA